MYILWGIILGRSMMKQVACKILGAQTVKGTGCEAQQLEPWRANVKKVLNHFQVKFRRAAAIKFVCVCVCVSGGSFNSSMKPSNKKGPILHYDLKILVDIQVRFSYKRAGRNIDRIGEHVDKPTWKKLIHVNHFWSNSKSRKLVYHLSNTGILLPSTQV